MTEKTQYTASQQNVIDYRGGNMLVSASAGTGKTTVMIERIVSLLREGADISEIVVVTFTNLAAAEMKNRLALKLSKERGSSHLAEQLEKLDVANISTLHSFCSELLRNYFYVVDVDPSFSVLDNNLTAVLRKNALDEVFLQYFSQNDATFKKAYRIFAKTRNEENFRNVILELYDFSRCIGDFSAWYAEKRQFLLRHDGSDPFAATLLKDIKQCLEYYARCLYDLAERGKSEGLSFAEVFSHNADMLRSIDTADLQNAMFGLCKFKAEAIPNRSEKKSFGIDKDLEEQIRKNYAEITEDIIKLQDKYAKLCRGENIDTLYGEMGATAEYLDKLVEITEKFGQTFYEMKKERGGLDFGDLEHLTLRLLSDSDTLAAIKEQYKLIFVDEYQDTNPVQEAIISALSDGTNLFMVGDVKQSIYGFRGCEPQIFVDKYCSYKTTDAGKAEELNDNFRSNGEILDFVNEVFSRIMTEDFGKVNYKRDAELHGSAKPVLKVPSVRVDIIETGEREKREIDSVYDIAEQCVDADEVKQGEVIARRIREYVGKAYRDKNGERRVIGYGDVVILMRSLTGKAVDIYNSLVSANIPVVANFKAEGYSSKEVRDVINLLRVLDNPYNDIYTVGTCLSPFGGFTESELGVIRLDTEGRIPFYDRLQNYAENGSNATLKSKIAHLIQFLVQLQFFSRGASVSETVLRALELTDYQRYVQALPNGGLRMRKLYAFIDGVKDAPYAVSIERFLAYIDEVQDAREETGLGQTNAVRMMTMHASKGLEFPVVIVAGLESSFRFDHPAVTKNFDLGLAMNYYDFASMRYARTVSSVACATYNEVKQLEEEMRLLYVAMTRAKFALELVASADSRKLAAVPKLPVKAKSDLDWLLFVLRDKFKTAQDIADSQTEVNVITELDDDEDVSEQNYLCEQITDEQAVKERIEYKYRYDSQTKMPSKVVSSALDKEYIDSQDDSVSRVLYDDNDRNKIGTAYHKVYQYVSYDADRERIAATIAGLVNEGKIEQRFADKLDTELIYSTLRNPELTKLLSQGAVYHEMPFMLLAPYDEIAKDKRFSDETMLQGVIDLLVVGENKAVVIDFKYTSQSGKVEERYAMQLSSYKLAVQRICGIEDVDCYVMSIADNKLIRFD